MACGGDIQTNVGDVVVEEMCSTSNKRSKT